MPEVAKQMRAYRLCLDPSQAERTVLARSAGASRAAFNYALGVKVATHTAWRAQVEALVEAGTDKATARTQVKVPIPRWYTVQKRWQIERGDDSAGQQGVMPWSHELNVRVFHAGFADADAAWRNWQDSLSGRRAGPAMGYPRFKKKGRCRDSFRICHDVKKPGIRPVGYRRLRIPKVGTIRLHNSAKPLVKAINAGALVTSVTVSRQGHRWYAAVVVRTRPSVAVPTRAQREAGRVGVDVGVNNLLALSTGELVNNPRHVRATARRLARAHRALARTQKGSTGREHAKARVGRLYGLLAERRATGLHTLTKRLTTRWSEVAVEDLAVAAMTASAKGTLANPGRNVKQKSGLNREILDVSPGEIRRQLDYKAQWYGATLLVCDRWFPSSKTCSSCGTVKPKLGRGVRVFRCEHCGYQADRDHNAARNIAAAAQPPTPNNRGRRNNADT